MVMYDKDGKETKDEKLAWIKHGNKFYIKCANGRIARPEDLMNGRLSWFKVEEKVYNLYMKFLTSKKGVFLTQAQREI